MKELKQYSIKTDFSTYQNISAIYIYFPNSADQLNIIQFQGKFAIL